MRPRHTRIDVILLVISIITLIIVFSFAFWAFYSIRDINIKSEQRIKEVIQSYSKMNGPQKIDKVIHEQVVTTLPPEKPREPREPINGKDASDEQVTEAVTQYMQENPMIVGDEQLARMVQEYFDKNPIAEGPIGPIGLTIFVRKNPLTAATECKVASDFSWQPLDSCL